MAAYPDVHRVGEVTPDDLEMPGLHVPAEPVALGGLRGVRTAEAATAAGAEEARGVDLILPNTPHPELTAAAECRRIAAMLRATRPDLAERMERNAEAVIQPMRNP
jgi:hypothetical protein